MGNLKNCENQILKAMISSEDILLWMGFVIVVRQFDIDSRLEQKMKNKLIQER